ncbi:MAG: hypothetical protein ACC651_14635, partial [Candidatus Scalindua sp.]
MKQSLHTGKEPNLQKIVIVSVVLHLLFITFAAIPIKTKEREFRSYSVNLVGPVEMHRGGKAPARKRIKKKRVPEKKIITRKKTATAQ